MPEKTSARRTCGTMGMHNRLLKTEPVYVNNRRLIERFTLDHAIRAARRAARVPTLTIPVVVHVVYKTAAENISKAQIRSQIDVLNQDYRKRNADIGRVPTAFRALAADAGIEFRLAVRDPNGSPTDGITRTRSAKTVFNSETDDIKRRSTGGHSPWPRDRYLNIWVGRRVADPFVGDLLGYAQFPGGPAATDGVVVAVTAFGSTGLARAPFNKGRTATHEVGHWLNLLHIWGDDGGGCTGSDSVRDTPNQAGPNSGRPVFPHVTCGNGPNGDLFMNYMDYTHDAAMFMFTASQVRRMRAALGGPRASILGSDALRPAPRVAPIALKLPPKGADLRKALGREVGGEVTKVFDGARWVPLSRAWATLGGPRGRRRRG